MVYVNPTLIHIYDTEFLEQALKNPRIPQSLKFKIQYELYKRKYNTNAISYKHLNYYKLEKLEHENNYYLCLGVAEFYVSATPECYDL